MKIPAVHTIKGAEQARWQAELAGADVILHQPIGAGFGALASEEIKAAYPGKTYVSFPSIHFAGFLPHLVTLRKAGGGTLGSVLGDFHDARIVAGFHHGLTVEKCLAGLGAVTFDMGAHFAACRAESLRREEGVDIPVLEDLIARSQQSQTLYTVNHPDNETMIRVARLSLRQLGLAQDRAFVPPAKKLMGWVIAAVPESVNLALGHSWRSRDYILAGAPLTLRHVVEASYDIYRKVADFDALIDFNRHRFAESLRRAA